MFTKHPFILPIIAIFILGFLYLFQKQQVKLSAKYREEHNFKAVATIKLAFNDPIYGSTQGQFVKCSNGAVTGREYGLSGNWAVGAAEFDLFSVHPESRDTLPLFAVYAAGTPACGAELLAASPFFLGYDVKQEQVICILKTKTGTVSSNIPLAKDLFPGRLRLEWWGDSTIFYLNGRTTVKGTTLLGMVPGERKLLLGQADTGKAKAGAELRSLKVYFGE